MIVGLNTWFSDIIFTSAFPDLELVSDQNWERLELWAGERSIFSVYLCVNENGLIYLTDLGQVMEQYMIENRLPFASFSLRESPERPEDPFRRDFVAVFSSYFWDDYAESFIAQNFLTTLSAKQISSSAYDMVAFISKRERISPFAIMSYSMPTGFSERWTGKTRGQRKRISRSMISTCRL